MISHAPCLYIITYYQPRNCLYRTISTYSLYQSLHSVYYLNITINVNNIGELFQFLRQVKLCETKLNLNFNFEHKDLSEEIKLNTSLLIHVLFLFSFRIECDLFSCLFNKPLLLKKCI